MSMSTIRPRESGPEEHLGWQCATGGAGFGGLWIVLASLIGLLRRRQV